MRYKTTFLICGGFCFLIFLWYLYAKISNPLLLASPKDTFSSLSDILIDKSDLKDFFTSLKRIFIGTLLAIVIGFILGIITGIKKEVQDFLEPLRWLLMSISPVIVVILSMLWFGLGDKMVIFLSIIILSPIIYINTIKGINYIDKSLLEMAQVYNFSLLLKIIKIYIPSIAASLSAAILTVVNHSARVVILAEVLGANNGIGQAISNARSNLEISKLFAWILLSLLIVAVFEYMILKPIERHFTKWKQV